MDGGEGRRGEMKEGVCMSLCLSLCVSVCARACT
jgi:hypothetical protein